MAAEPDVEALSVTIQPMRRRHIRAVLRIEQQVYPRPWSSSLFLSELALRATRAYYVARVGRELVGYAGLMMTLDDGHVTTIAVDPEHQGGRIGTRLLLVLVRRAVEQGAEAVTLEVRTSNEPAKALYRRFGFSPAGVRKGYYRDPVEDALVLWAHDINRPEYAERLAAIEAELPSPLVAEGLAPLPPRPEPPEEGLYL